MLSALIRSLDVEVLAEAIALQDVVRTQVAAGGRLLAAAHLWCGAGEAGHASQQGRSAVPGDRTTVRLAADPARVTPSDRSGGLLQEALDTAARRGARAAVLLAFGHEPGSLEPRMAVIQLESPGLGRLAWHATLRTGAGGEVCVGEFVECEPPRRLPCLVGEAQGEAAEDRSAPALSAPGGAPRFQLN